MRWDDATWPEDRFSFRVEDDLFDDDGDDYIDDPFSPKPTCSFCRGTGMLPPLDGSDDMGGRTCYWCYGTGVENGR